MRHCARRDFVKALGLGAAALPRVRASAEHAQLFDLAADPRETTNLANLSTHAAGRRGLEALRARRQERLDDPRLRGGEE